MTRSLKLALAAAALALTAAPAAHTDAADLAIISSGPIDVTQGESPTLDHTVTLVADTPVTDITSASAAILVPEDTFTAPMSSNMALISSTPEPSSVARIGFGALTALLGIRSRRRAA